MGKDEIRSNCIHPIELFHVCILIRFRVRLTEPQAPSISCFAFVFGFALEFRAYCALNPCFDRIPPQEKNFSLFCRRPSTIASFNSLYADVYTVRTVHGGCSVVEGAYNIVHPVVCRFYQELTV